MKAAIRFLFAIGCIIGTQGASYAIQPGERVDNFRLSDQSGASHELHYLSDAEAIVLMVFGVKLSNREVPWGDQTWDEMNAG